MTTKKKTRRGEAPVAGRHPNLPTTGFNSLSPSEFRGSISLNGLGSSRPNSSLTTEEIASKGSGRHRATLRSHTDPFRGFPSLDDIGSSFRHGRFHSCPADFGTRARVAVWLNCSPVTVRACLGPLSRATGPRISSLTDVRLLFGRGGIGRRTGPRSRRTMSMRVRLSPPVLWREPG
jgi:hypothetical protein